MSARHLPSILNGETGELPLPAHLLLARPQTVATDQLARSPACGGYLDAGESLNAEPIREHAS
jgi:hypothetical protein